MIQDSDLLSIQELRQKVAAAHEAFLEFRRFPQARIDAIVEAMAEAARTNARRLAELAVTETGYGNVPDKTAKNLLTADLLPRTIRGMRTVGVLREVPEQGIVEVGVPMGVIGAILPTTNPTSTAIFKSIIALKAGNAIVLSPHPYARQSTCATIDLMHQAATGAGAPQGIIQCLTLTSQETTNQLMKHPKVAAILATGGAGLVRAAYSSGKPAFGVGPGNVPVLLDTTANLPEAIGLVVDGKSFDYGTVCSSEQSLVCQESLRATVLSELRMKKAFLCDDSQTKALEQTLIQPNGRINPDCVGKSPQVIAQLAGFAVPPDARILVCQIEGVGKDFPLSAEKLSPVLSVIFVSDFPAALETCERVLQFGGLGHTCVIHSKDESRIREFGLRMPAFRVLVNTASPQGSTGITTNLFPSMTLGCGAIAGNITSDNVGPHHLMNIKRIASVARKASDAFTVAAETLPGGAIPAEAQPATPAPTLPSPAAQRVTAPGRNRPIEHQAVAAAVEQYLASKGISVNASSPGGPVLTGATAPASGTGAKNIAAPNPGVAIASIVDQFLASRPAAPRARPAAPRATTAAPVCGCAIAGVSPAVSPESEGQAPSACQRSTTPAAEPSAPGTPPAMAPTPESAVDFVCEDDVRRAMTANRKIRLKPKAILTPSARDLGERHGVFLS